MSCDIRRAYSGDFTMVEYAIACPNVDASTLTWKRFGMIDTTSISNEWGVEDATGDTSPRGRKEKLVTRMDSTGSFSYVAMGSAIQNQQELIRHIKSPTDATDYQPLVWLRFTDPTTVEYGPYILPSQSSERPVQGKVTGTINFEANGEIITADNPNPNIAQETPAI